MAAHKIPEGWEEKTIGEVLSQIGNGTSSKQIGSFTMFPVTRIETISKGEIDCDRVGYLKKPEEKYLLKKGDILFSNINSVSHIGKVAIKKDHNMIYHGMNLLLLRFNQKLSSFFGYYLLLYNKKTFEKNSAQAVNQASINQNSLKQLKLYLPTSLEEQKKIASILSTVDEAIAQTEQLIAKLERLKTGLMQDLLTRGIDENGQLRNEATHEFKDSPLGRIPVEWEVKTIGNVCDTSSGSTPNRQHSEYFGGDIPWVKTGELGVKYVSSSDENITERGLQFSACKLVPKASLLIAMYGATIGQLGILKIDATTNQACCALQPNSHVSNEYIYYQLLINKKKLVEQGVGAAQPNISQKVIRAFLLPFPNLKEQQNIAELLSKTEQEIEQEQTKRSKLQSVKRGLMQDLLTGRVRVKI